MNFKEFLEKHHKETWSLGAKQVSQEALGEWALERASYYNKKPHTEYLGKMKLLMEIATDCLGEEKVKKHLEKLK
ncbi:hypothetical protein LCGC14_0700130 [marine sediment metagenome]|uniref:Uncharacterized protein n=1 Tax=marine sediment metagenome TaxID=412755 RepID=A0A0F9T408_9ZZZZ